MASDAAARRVEAAIPLSFSTDRDGGEPGAPDDDARGRQASAMSARLAQAVASTSERPTSDRSMAPSQVFAIPSMPVATSQAVTATTEVHIAAAPGLPPENVDRVVQAMHVNVRSGVMEATVRLRPEYLGEVTIQLRVDGSNVTALIHTEAPGVRQWLESQEQSIRNGLAAHGLTLDRLVINPDGEQQQSRDDSEANESRRRAYRRRQQSSERFEITV
jgi:flagellar hook-length control protein FliK